jgi:hypothetical protein
MEITYNNEEKILMFKIIDRTFALHRIEPKIEETGLRGFINEENIFSIERVLNMVKANDVLCQYCMDNLNLKDKFDVLIYFMPNLCKFYSTPEYGFDKLKNLTWQYIFGLKVIENWKNEGK